MRRWLVPASLLIAACPAFTALADGNCPPGSWFCEETPVAPPPQQSDDDDTPPTATNPQEAPAPKKHKKHTPAAQAPAQAPGQGSVGANGSTQIQSSGEVQIQASGPVVIYTQNGQQVITQPGSQPPPPPVHPPPPAVRRVPWREHFGLNLRAEGAGFSSATGDRVGMGGAGLSMRWRPAPAFALDAGLDILGGNDYYSKTRIESAVSLSGIVFFNPKSLLQVYMLGGFHVSHAEIEDNNSYCANNGGSICFDSGGSTGRDYIGLQGGLGVELRLAKHFGIDLDGLGILRTGIGNGPPEFTNPKTGQTSDTSGAGRARAGVTFWW